VTITWIARFPCCADFLLLEQVLFNLLDNAAKFSPAGSAIGIVGSREDGDAVVSVRDEGPGIPPQDLERIFDKFYRVQSGDRQRAGTGLGLAICRGFIEAQGGWITASRGDGGAISTICLPIGIGIAPWTGRPAHNDPAS
jgi:two-component system sensor histidine kinase KdpD